jgi:hypothetical protein
MRMTNSLLRGGVLLAALLALTSPAARGDSGSMNYDTGSGGRHLYMQVRGSS